ncbi:MAG: hypothetical protein AAGC44_10830 [Planctomycetota bacterium]
MNHRNAARYRRFVFLAQAAVPAQPGERPRQDPRLAQHRQGFYDIAAFDHFDLTPQAFCNMLEPRVAGRRVTEGSDAGVVAEVAGGIRQAQPVRER